MGTGVATSGPAGVLTPGPGQTRNGGFVSIDGDRYACITDVDAMPPFLMSIVSDNDVWVFVGSNGPFSAGRGSPDGAIFPCQTADKILRDANSGGARTAMLVSRGGASRSWEPWQGGGQQEGVRRNLYKRVDGTGVLFEEINEELGLRFRWSLSACHPFGLVRHALIEEIAGEPVDIRYLDGWHQIIPPGVDQDTYARLSYLAIAYMRHERLADVPLALYTLNTTITDRPDPAESLRAAVAWSIGHPDPVIHLTESRLASFRHGGRASSAAEVRAEMGAYLAEDSVRLEPHATHDWYTVVDTGSDHPAVLELKHALRSPETLRAALRAAMEADREGLQRRVAAADGIQVGADEAATANHYANVLFNIMRGGSFEQGYAVPRHDLDAYLRDQDRTVHEQHQAWLETLPERMSLHELRRACARTDDPQLQRLVGSYLPLTFSRRHGDPSRPWNRFSIRVRDERGDPVYGYEGNWRDIFQNWEALGLSYPGFLPHFIAVFLDASTADGYNPYRVTRAGIDWEVEDPEDPWSHIGYWGDHQVVYLHRLLDAWERHEPGVISSRLNERVYAYADVPYRIGGFEAIIRDPRHTITFDRARHEAVLAGRRELGADAVLIRDGRGDVRLVTLGEKLLVPLLVKLTNLVPGSGIWLNTQRPEWNDANNALAGWGVSLVTLSSISAYVRFLGETLPAGGHVLLTRPVARLLRDLRDVLGSQAAFPDDATRLALMRRLGSAGETHRRAVYAHDLGELVSTPITDICRLLGVVGEICTTTLRASRRPDGLFHSYDLLSIEDDRAGIEHLGPMLEGQVAILASGLLDADEAIDLLRALRTSELYRADQHSYLLYPDQTSVPYLERNTISGDPPTHDPSLFVADREGRWHFQADLRTLADVDARLDAIGADGEIRSAVRELWRMTFDHASFTGRSGRFFMFEGLGSVYWHMVAKLALAAQESFRRASYPAEAADLADLYHDIRDGLGFRKTAEVHGAFPTDPYSHTPAHLGAQQPGMTGQAKEQVLTRFGELGIDVRNGCIRLDPRLLPGGELLRSVGHASFPEPGGGAATLVLPAGSLAFTLCQVPFVLQEGAEPSIELVRTDGRRERVQGLQLDRPTSAEIFERRGGYRCVTVTIPRGTLYTGSGVKGHGLEAASA